MQVVNGVGTTLAGFELSGVDAAGVSWKVNDIEAWDDLPGTTGQSYQQAYGDGAWVDEAFWEAQPLRLLGRIYAPDRASAADALSRLKAAVPMRSPRPLVVSSDGLVRHRMVRLEGKPKFPPVTDQFIRFDIQLTDPLGRLLSGDGTTGFTHSAVTSLPVVTGGLVVDGLQAPFQVVATAAAGSVTVTNGGNARPPVAVLLTNVVNPTITADDGQVMRFAITVGAGQTLEVDLDAKTVKLNGVNRRNTLSGGWIVAADGTELSFNASTYNATARMTVRWSDAWR